MTCYIHSEFTRKGFGQKLMACIDHFLEFCDWSGKFRKALERLEKPVYLKLNSYLMQSSEHTYLAQKDRKIVHALKYSSQTVDHRNPLIQQILRKYNYLSSFKEIVFCWLPSHTYLW